MKFYFLMQMLTSLDEKLMQLTERSLKLATIDDLNAKTQEVLDAVTAERLEVQAKLADMAVQLQTLTDTLAAGGAATPAQLDEIVAKLQSVTDEVKNISEPLPVAAEPVVEEPVVEPAPVEPAPVVEPTPAPTEPIAVDENGNPIVPDTEPEPEAPAA